MRVRRSSRTTGAVFSPPRPLSSNDFKEWPSEGMHERPKFNSETSTLEKYDFPPTKQPKTTFKKPDMRKKINKTKYNRKGRKSKQDEEVSNKEFAQLIHSTFLAVHGYVKQMKQSNAGNKDNETKASEQNTEALETAEDLFENSCVLYSVCNNIKQADLSKYLENLNLTDSIDIEANSHQ